MGLSDMYMKVKTTSIYQSLLVYRYARFYVATAYVHMYLCVRQVAAKEKDSAELREHVQSQSGRMHMLQKQIHERDRQLQQLDAQLQQQQGGDDAAAAGAQRYQELQEKYARLTREVKASKQQAQNAKIYIDQYSEYNVMLF